MLTAQQSGSTRQMGFAHLRRYPRRCAGKLKEKITTSLTTHFETGLV